MSRLVSPPKQPRRDSARENQEWAHSGDPHGFNARDYRELRVTRMEIAMALNTETSKLFEPYDTSTAKGTSETGTEHRRPRIESRVCTESKDSSLQCEERRRE